MKRPLRILHLEDQPDYSDLVQSLLSQEVPSEVTTVATRRHYEQAIGSNNYDLILADYLLPDFDGLSALQIAREKCPDTPFLMLSGTAETESAAIEMLARGATDYVLKALPERLLPAVKRALRESADRSARKRIETELKQNERHFRTFTENALDVLTIAKPSGKLIYNSPSLKAVLGYDPSEVMGSNVLEFVHPEDRAGE